jgi:hypothetical protein
VGGGRFLAVTFSTYVLFFVIPTNRPGSSNVQGRDITTGVNQATGIHGPVWHEYGVFLWRIVTVQSLDADDEPRGGERGAQTRPDHRVGDLRGAVF